MLRRFTDVRIHFGPQTRLVKLVRDKAPEFKEAAHPRDEHGRWRKGAGGFKHGGKEIGWQHTHRQITPAEQDRLKRLRVPPGWSDVKLNPDHSAALQVVGKDSKGRPQYVYSAVHSAYQAAAKFERLRQFNEAVPMVRHTALNGMARGDDAAAVTYLIDRTGFRIGSETDTKAKDQAYGASTLRSDHVSIDGDTIAFDFIGKKGVRIQKKISDTALARYLAPKIEAGGKLFDTDDARVRAFLKKAAGNDAFKVKDYRTWHGTGRALEIVQSMPEPTTKAELARARLAVGKAVAEHLGNTPTVALESYIDPTVFARWGI